MNTAAHDLIDELRAYKRSHALATAVGLGILNAMLAGKATIASICDVCSVETDYGRLLLNVLIHFDLVERCDDEYVLTPTGQEVARDNTFMPFAAYHMYVYEAWQALEASSRGEVTLGGFHCKRIADPYFCEAYLKSMEAMAQSQLQRLIQRCAPLLQGTVLDIGAGPSTLCRYLAAQQKCEVTALDLPKIVEKAQELFSFPESYEWVSQDFCCFEPSARFDGVFCGHLLEYCSADGLPKWLQKMQDCLQPGGYAVIVVFLRESGRLDVNLDLFEISTALNGESLGHICTVEEIQAILSKNGAKDIAIEPLTGGVSHPEYLVTCRWDT